MTAIEIRRAGLDDVSALVAFNQVMALETENKELDAEILRAGVQTLLKRPELGFYLLAIKDGKALGSLMVTSEWSDWRNGLFWWIQSVYIDSEYRRQGIYRRLYQAVRQLAEAEGDVCGFRLYVEQDNLDAQQTYQALGMERTVYQLFEQSTCESTHQHSY